MRVKPGSFPKIKMTVERVLDQVERRGMKEALMRAARPLRDKAKAMAPTRHGDLKRSIGISGRTEAGTGRAVVHVGPRRKFKGKHGGRPAWYAHLVEYGHSLKVGGKMVGFVGPKPFLRPAFEAAADEARRIYARELPAMLMKHFGRAKQGGRL